jgi:hypothetical protein
VHELLWFFLRWFYLWFCDMVQNNSSTGSTVLTTKLLGSASDDVYVYAATALFLLPPPA